MVSGMMEKTSLRAYGKINITLDITGKRDDGYHLLNTILQTVDVFDEVTLSKRPKGIMVNVDQPFIPADERNLAFKAAKIIKEKFRLKEGVLIEIKKKIPVGGGMAGGSTDAACVIIGMNRLFDLKMDQAEQDEIALRIGADVPFCLRRGTFLAEGIGEKLTRLTPMPDLSVLICAPAFQVSTQQAYQAYDERPETIQREIEPLLEGMKTGDLNAIFSNMHNSLEPVVEMFHPEIGLIKKCLLESGAQKAMMSGSGSTVFGLFENPKTAEAACDVLKTQIPDAQVLLTGFVR